MKKNSAFSLIELSVVLLIVGILIAGVTQAGIMIKNSRIQSARLLTKESPVNDIDNLVVWYETSLDSSFVAGEAIDNTIISAWNNNNKQSLGVNNATQATTTSKPKYIANVFNGAIPAIRFDGTDDFMSYDGTFLAGSNYTIFVVEQRTSNKSNNFFMGGSTAATNKDLVLGYAADTTIKQAHYGNDLSFTIQAFVNPTPRIHSFWFSASTGGGKKYWLNGGNSADASDSSQTESLTDYLNAYLGRYFTNNYFFGDIAEVIIFNGALKNSERQSIETYLSKKYSIVIS